jgi:putative oxidoreductase
MMFIHGWPKIIGGSAGWEHAGAALAAVVGIHFWPTVWGFLVALCQTLGGAMIAIGFLARPFSIALSFIMVLASVMVYQKTGGDFKQWSHPAESAIACLAMAIMGTGRFGWDNK